jgi:hypothetical protein
VGRSGGGGVEEAFGGLTYDAGAARCTDDTIFDLASLTKVISTASIAMRLVERGLLSLDGIGARSAAGLRSPALAHGTDSPPARFIHRDLPAHLRLWQTARGGP